ncbi:MULTISPECIES: 7,8-didemethyl-8-hydroxy-5-deazariboflavin synthase subunit CofG [Aphanothece]|uniref:7,8-didemethyl-8-hydroxy-5-deazariboflavin synthase subunit CofG n=1 Tax=Aphanothece TaxID=1121 RepID=UPI00398537FE
MRGRAAVVTWSPSVTLVPTRGCFNRCDYCGFRLSPDPRDPLADALGDRQALALLGSRPQALEVLLLSGEVPPASAHRTAWFARLVALSRLALAQGRLPHTNAGPLSRTEMARLGRLNPSLGLMLEGLGPAYDALHRQAPSKRLEQRLAQLEQAGRLGVPFTTGLLLGVGESRQDQRDALELIALLHASWGHVQEVILQPFRPAGAEGLPLPAATCESLLELIAEARRILPPEVHLQLPPNLWPLEHLVAALEAGIDDLGGIDTVDVINPAYPQPTAGALAEHLAAAGWELRPRLCVHPAWIAQLPAALRARAEAMAQRLGRGG